MALIEIRLRPSGPWRAGQHAGDRERVDGIYHSDALYSAVTHAMNSLGWMEDWLDATAKSGASGAAVRFSSLFPYSGETRLLPPPRSSSPPAAAGKLYLGSAKLVPLQVALNGISDESKWSVDGACECLLPLGASAPFEVSLRSAAAVDRLTGSTEPHRTACLEFAPGAGFWGLVQTDEVWESRVKSAIRLLADSGFGGERSRGWGRAEEPHFTDASRLFPAVAETSDWWLLSLYSPHPDDVIDWTRSHYDSTTRAGWTDSTSGSVKKKLVRMIGEGSVISAPSVKGQAVDVAPDDFAHPVYRAGFALAVPMPVPVTDTTTSGAEA